MPALFPEALALISALALLKYLLALDLGRYAITTVGTAPRLRRRQAREGDCSHDDCDGDAVERRVAAREYVLFGAPVWRRTMAANQYCERHASFEFSERDTNTDPTATTTSFEDMGDTNMVATGTSAFNLFGAGIVVIIAMIILSIVDLLGGDI